MDFQGFFRAYTIKSIVILALLFFIVGVAHSGQSRPLAEGDEETVTLNLGTTDSQQYGRNYGRDKNNFRLDVSFTPTPDTDHRIQWQAFDIESSEMEIFLNDIKVKTLSQTSANQLGPIDQLSLPVLNLGLGSNTLSFRVNGGNETWGVTNLRVDALDEPGDDEVATTVLLDAPDLLRYSSTTRSYDFNFNFTPRGNFYNETILISFDTRLRNGTRNGFDVFLNGRNILRIATYTGRATAIVRRVNLDKSEFNIGGNTLSIRTTSRSSVSNSETQIANVKVENRSEPLADISVVGLRLGDRSSPSDPFTMISGVTNLGVAESLPKTIAYYRSANDDLSEPVLLASELLAALAVAGFVEISASIERSEIKSSHFYWACVEPRADEVDMANDCSPPIVIDVGVAIAPVIMLLLGN